MTAEGWIEFGTGLNLETVVHIDTLTNTHFLWDEYATR